MTDCIILESKNKVLLVTEDIYYIFKELMTCETNSCYVSLIKNMTYTFCLKLCLTWMELHIKAGLAVNKRFGWLY